MLCSVLFLEGGRAMSCWCCFPIDRGASCLSANPSGDYYISKGGVSRGWMGACLSLTKYVVIMSSHSSSSSSRRSRRASSATRDAEEDRREKKGRGGGQPAATTNNGRGGGPGADTQQAVGPHTPPPPPSTNRGSAGASGLDRRGGCQQLPALPGARAAEATTARA